MNRSDKVLSLVLVALAVWVATMTRRVASNTVAIARLENRVYELEQRTVPLAPGLETEE